MADQKYKIIIFQPGREMVTHLLTFEQTKQLVLEHKQALEKIFYFDQNLKEHAVTFSTKKPITSKLITINTHTKANLDRLYTVISKQ